MLKVDTYIHKCLIIAKFCNKLCVCVVIAQHQQLGSYNKKKLQELKIHLLKSNCGLRYNIRSHHNHHIMIYIRCKRQLKIKRSKMSKQPILDTLFLALSLNAKVLQPCLRPTAKQILDPRLQSHRVLQNRPRWFPCLFVCLFIYLIDGFSQKLQGQFF